MKPHPLAFEAFLIFLLGLIVFSTGLFNHEFVQFESRFGLFAQEMLRNGVSFFPTTYGKYYPDYPATQAILTYLFSLPFGKVTIITAVLPTALASSLTLVFIYLIGALHNKYWGIYAVLFALLTFEFLFAARTISLDQFTTAATAACFYLVYSEKKQKISYEKISHTFQQSGYKCISVPLIWILSFAFRGPIGFIIPAVIVCTYYFFEKDWRRFFNMLSSAVVIFLLCLAGLLAAAWHTGGRSFMEMVIHMQATHRLTSAASVPFYYYFTASFIYYALSFPVAIAIFAVYSRDFWRAEISPSLRLLRHLVIGLLIILFGMSVPSDEKMRYILPIMPAIALGAAYLYSTEHANFFLSYLRKGINHLCVISPFVGLIVTIGCLVFSWQFSMPLALSYPIIFFLFLLLIIVEIIFKRKIWHPQKRELSLFCLGVAAFVFLYIYIAQPIDVQLNRAKPFVEKIENLRAADQAIVFYRIGPDGEDIKFMVALDKPIQPFFLQSPTDLVNFTKPAIFIAKIEDFSALSDSTKQKLQILYEGHLGHQDCVAFKRSS